MKHLSYSRIIARLTWTLIGMASFSIGYSQSIENVDFSVSNNQILVTYDLVNCPADRLHDLKLFYSLGGESYEAINVTGKLYQQSSGRNKSITWNVLKDRDELRGNIQVEVKNVKTYLVEMETVFRKNRSYPAGVIRQSGKSQFKDVYITGVARPTAPANLEISSITFSDQYGNNNSILDAGERAEITFTLANIGKGDAYNLVVEIDPVVNVNGIKYAKSYAVGNLIAGKSTLVRIPVSASALLESGRPDVEIYIREANGFDSDPIRISFDTQSLKSPIVEIADHKFSTIDGGKIKLGQLISLGVALQNRGQGEATNIRVQFINPGNIYPAGETDFVIERLRPNETTNVVYEFFANKKYNSPEISIQALVYESYNQQADKKLLSVSLEQNVLQTQTISVTGLRDQEIKISNFSMTSDVDVGIPASGKTSANRFALIIGNEDYSKYQTGLQSEQNVLFARNDATIFREYAIKTLGVPERHAFMLTDATRGQMSRELERVTELVKLTPNAELIFYYAGHGLPDIETHRGYLIPVDVTASSLVDAISLKDLYSKLASSNANKVIVFLDACFSGGGRGENGLIAARTVKVKPKGEIVAGNIVSFTAASGEEVSLPLKQESHGLFTYHVLKKLKESHGLVTLEQLKLYLENEIPKSSLIENGVRQTPQVLVAPDLDEKWLTWNF